MKNYFLILTICFALVLGTQTVFAQQGGGSPAGGGQGQAPVTIGTGIVNPFNCNGAPSCTVNDLLIAIVNKIILPVGGIVAVLAFIWSGFLFVTAQGNESKVKGARTALLNTAIGTAVLLGSWVIANLIKTTIDQLK